MEKRRFGKTDMEVTALGFGGAEIGYQDASPETVERLLNAALDAGLNVIDTAECYMNSEELIGRAVSHRRRDYYLFTKCGHFDSWSDGWSREHITASIDRSLKRLQTDHLDLVQLHSCTSEVLQKGEAVEALQRAREAGKTRFIGYSGDGDDALYAIRMDVFDALQTSVSIADQQAIDTTLPEASARAMGVIAKRPIANTVWRLGDQKPEDDYYVAYWERLRLLDYDFLKGDMREAVSVALRFTLSVPEVDTAIVGTTKPGRWRENAALVAQGKLLPAEFASIRNRWRETVAAHPDMNWVGQV